MGHLWWLMYIISCFRVFVLKDERRRHENMYFFRYFDFRGEDTKYARRNNDILTGEGTKISLLKISCRRVEIFRVVALCLLCLRVFSDNYDEIGSKLIYHMLTLTMPNFLNEIILSTHKRKLHYLHRRNCLLFKISWQVLAQIPMNERFETTSFISCNFHKERHLEFYKYISNMKAD